MSTPRTPCKQPLAVPLWYYRNACIEAGNNLTRRKPFFDQRGLRKSFYLSKENKHYAI